MPRRSAAAGEDVGASADAPRAGPLRCFELAATDLGAATLALVETGGLHRLGGFAFARHGTSLLTALREVEFLAKIFFRVAVLRGSAGALTKICRLEKDVFADLARLIPDGD